jgi:flagellar biosynthesis protein FliR
MNEMHTVMEQMGVGTNFQFVFIFAMLVWTRILAMTATVPFLWGKPVPMVARVGASALLMLFVVPFIIPESPPPITDQSILIVFLFIKEAVYGVVIGFTASLIFFGFEAAGHMIENQRGMSIARVLIPQLGTQGSLASQLLFLMSVAVYYTLDGHIVFLEAFYGTYHTMPVLELPNIDPGWFPLVSYLTEVSGHVVTMAIAISAPVIIAILLADIILGVANRMAPQINVWELGFNVKGYVGVLLFALMMTLMLPVMQESFERGHDYNRTVMRLLERRDLPIPPATEEDVIPPLPWMPE